MDEFLKQGEPIETEDKARERIKSHVIRASVAALNAYDPKPTAREDNPEFWAARSLPDLMEVLRTNPDIQVDAKILGVTAKGKPTARRMNRESFTRAVRNARPRMGALREGYDSFASGDGFFDGGASGGFVGQDFVPLLGGPFNKQPYIRDYLAAHMQCFYAMHHDPFGRRIPSLMRDFTLGRDWRLDTSGPDEEIAKAIWSATMEANDIYSLMDTLAFEVSGYGETMVWELPNNETKIVQRPTKDEKVPKGLLPRFRLIDPSCIWDIITQPEDITNVLSYQWVAPTQYQIYTNDKATGERVPTLKYIYQQIPAFQVDHYKINCVSNEKRGRSDLYPVLGYLKRLRDAVNYMIIAQQKSAAYCIDTTIDGNQNDIDAYSEAQEALGPIPSAGSEFIHSKRITRAYLGTEGGSGARDYPSFDWCISMIAAGTGIPVTYFGVHLAAGQTRASAMTATEPVVKLFEGRRNLYRKVLTNMFNRTMKKFNLKASCEVTFPEIVSQDRSAKFKDLALAEEMQWISGERAGTLASKELSIRDYDFGKEQEDIKAEQPLPPEPQGFGILPLTSPGAAQGAPTPPAGAAAKPNTANAPAAKNAPPAVKKATANAKQKGGASDAGALAHLPKFTQDEKHAVKKGRGA